MTNPKCLPTEFGIHMVLDKSRIVQQSELNWANEDNYFDSKSPCHIYFICRRPRITIDPTKFSATRRLISLTFKVQNQDSHQSYTFDFQNNFGTADLDLSSSYPYTNFELKHNGVILTKAKAAVFLQSIPLAYTNADFFKFGGSLYWRIRTR